MQLFFDIRLRTKFMVMAAFMFAAVAFMGIGGMLAIQRVDRNGQRIYQTAEQCQYILAAESSIQEAGAVIYQHLLTNDPERMTRYEEIISGQRQKLEAALKSYEELGAEPDAVPLLSQARTRAEDYFDRLTQIFEMSRNGMKDEALLAANRDLQPVREAAAEEFSKLSALDLQHAQAQKAKNAQMLKASLQQGWLAMIVVAPIAFVMGILSAYLMTVPLTAIHQVADALTKGDLTKDVRFKSKDEFGQLALAVTHSVQGLRGLVWKVSDASAQVAAASQELAASSQQVGDAAEQVTQTITQLSRGAEEQAESAQAAGQVTEEMSRSIDRVTDLSEKMSFDAEQAVDTARQGDQTLRQAVRQMEAIEAAAQRSAAAIENLGGKSQEIGRIVDLIANIAGQTNLLALNASVEAARAGEHGRGFAVVAEEVGKLAAQTREAAEQISGLIRQIQEETDKAVTAIEGSSQEVAEGSRVITGTGEAFRAIAQAVETIVVRTGEVTAAMQNLASGSQQVVKTVEAIASVTEETAAGTQEVSASAQQQGAAVLGIASSAQSLAELARDLDQAVQSFQLPQRGAIGS